MYKIDLDSITPIKHSPSIYTTLETDLIAERNQEDAETLTKIVIRNCKITEEHYDIVMHYNPLLEIDEKKIIDNNCFVLISSYLYRYDHYREPPLVQNKQIDCLNLIALCEKGKKHLYDFIFDQMNLETTTGWTGALREFFKLCNDKVIETKQRNFPNSLEFGIELLRRYAAAIENEDSIVRYTLLAKFLIKSRLFTFEGFAYFLNIEKNEMYVEEAFSLYKRFAPEETPPSPMISTLVDLIASMPTDLSQEPWGVAEERLKTMVLQGMFAPHLNKSLLTFFWKMMESYTEDWHTLLSN